MWARYPRRCSQTCLGGRAIWAGPRGYSNIQSVEKTEAATAAAAAGAATKRGGSREANNPLPHHAIVPWEEAGWSRAAHECTRACAHRLCNSMTILHHSYYYYIII